MQARRSLEERTKQVEMLRKEQNSFNEKFMEQLRLKDDHWSHRCEDGTHHINLTYAYPGLYVDHEYAVNIPIIKMRRLLLISCRRIREQCVEPILIKGNFAFMENKNSLINHGAQP